MNDVFSNVKIQNAFAPATATDTDGVLVNVSKYTGQAIAHLNVAEAASQAASKTLTVTVHNVASDSEATAAGNLVGSFTVIAGSNEGSGVTVSEAIAIDLSQLTHPYLQVKAVLANAYSGVMSVVIAATGNAQNPVN